MKFLVLVSRIHTDKRNVLFQSIGILLHNRLASSTRQNTLLKEDDTIVT